MDTFILRIYRRTDNDITGLSEHVETGRKQQFQDLNELFEIINNIPNKLKKQKQHALKKIIENQDK